jgi:hypothetical protein
MTIRSAAALFLALSTNAFGWGQLGHETVASVASLYLSPSARKAVQKLLGEESMAKASIWPDEIRSNPRFDFAKPWHFVQIDPGSEYQSEKIAHGGDILTALTMMEKILRSKEKPYRSDKVQIGKGDALRFLIHFVGDIHQPLHVSNGHDRGANACNVKWHGKANSDRHLWSLHSVWDFGLLESLRLSPEVLARRLAERVTKNEVLNLQASTYLDWANESKAIRPNVYPQVGGKIRGELEQPYCGKYKVETKTISPREWKEVVAKIRKDKDIPNLGKSYEKTFLPVVESQLLKAGVRLAGTLNKVFANLE